MAIQIDEKLLSAVAKEALKNAKSKSQLLRDALEAYVRMDIPNVIEINNSIKEIKDMLICLSDKKTIGHEAKAIQEVVAAAEENKTENVSLNEEEKRRIEMLYDSSLMGFGEGDFV